MQQHDQIPVFYTLKKKKVNYLVKLLIEVLLYQPRGHFIAAACFLTAKIKGNYWLLHAVTWSCKIQAAQNGAASSIQRALPFLGHVVAQPKDGSSSIIPSASNSLAYGDITTGSWAPQLPCAHTASLSACVSHISVTHPIFPELLMGFNLNSSVVSQTAYQQTCLILATKILSLLKFFNPFFNLQNK